MIIYRQIGPWLAGLLLATAGMLLGSDLGNEAARLLGGEPGIWARLGKGLTWGGVIAALQWPVVRSTGTPFIRFLSAGALALAVGYPLGQTIQGIFVSRWSMHWAGYGCALATFGLCPGISQWWLLHRRVPHASLWILFSVAGWMLWGAVLSGPFVDVVDSGVYGTVVGLGLVWLARSPRPPVAGNGPTASG